MKQWNALKLVLWGESADVLKTLGCTLGWMRAAQYRSLYEAMKREERGRPKVGRGRLLIDAWAKGMGREQS